MDGAEKDVRLPLAELVASLADLEADLRAWPDLTGLKDQSVQTLEGFFPGPPASIPHARCPAAETSGAIERGSSKTKVWREGDTDVRA